MTKRKSSSPVEALAASWKAMFRSTTLGGLVHMALATNWFIKALWIALFLFLGCITGWNVYLIIDDYQSYPVKMIVNEQVLENAAIPAVTVCGTIPFTCPQLIREYLKHPLEFDRMMINCECNHFAAEPDTVQEVC